MTTHDAYQPADLGEADRALKKRHATMWAFGDYPAVVTDVVGELGPILVEAAGIRSGDRVLDVAAGSGNVAIPAAQAGAEVIASDLTPELLATGERHAGDGRGRADLGDRRRRGAALRRRGVRRRAVLRRGDVRAAPPGRRRRAGPGLPARAAPSG